MTSTAVILSATATTTYSIIQQPLLRSLLFLVLEAPLLTLYLQGPQLGGYGFWEGLQYNEICARLTGVDAAHWSSSSGMVECLHLIDRKFNAFLILNYFILYIFILFLSVPCLVRCVCRRLQRPATRGRELIVQSENKKCIQ